MGLKFKLTLGEILYDLAVEKLPMILNHPDYPKKSHQWRYPSSKALLFLDKTKVDFLEEFFPYKAENGLVYELIERYKQDPLFGSASLTKIETRGGHVEIRSFRTTGIYLVYKSVGNDDIEIGMRDTWSQTLEELSKAIATSLYETAAKLTDGIKDERTKKT